MAPERRLQSKVSWVRLDEQADITEPETLKMEKEVKQHSRKKINNGAHLTSETI